VTKYFHFRATVFSLSMFELYVRRVVVVVGILLCLLKHLPNVGLEDNSDNESERDLVARGGPFPCFYFVNLRERERERSCE
jgi:hypothetical protein